MLKKTKIVVLTMLIFGLGIVVGGYLFGQVKPRSILAISDCKSNGCYRSNEVIGLIAAITIQHAPHLIPNIVKETDRCLAIKNPFPDARYHFVIFPKKDIKNIGEISTEDQAYVMDCFGIMQSLIEQYQLKSYRVLSNGPGLQKVAYLHFHLTAK